MLLGSVIVFVIVPVVVAVVFTLVVVVVVIVLPPNPLYHSKKNDLCLSFRICIR